MNHLLFQPSHLLDRAVRGEHITQQQADSKYFKDIAQEIAEEWSADWDEDEGFGSSDMTYAVNDFLTTAGYKTAFPNGRLTIIDHNEGLPKTLKKRKENAEKLLGYPLSEYYCKRLFNHDHLKMGDGGNTVGDNLDKGIFGNLTIRQHTQVGDAAIDLGRYYTSL